MADRSFRQMWKICQEPNPKTEVMALHSTALPRQQPQRNLACFWAGFGILIIEGKKRNAAASGLFLCWEEWESGSRRGRERKHPKSCGSREVILKSQQMNRLQAETSKMAKKANETNRLAHKP
jgi:hypothetical protein